MPRPSNPWLPGAGAGRAGRLRLFCFPFAGGGASIYNSWQAALPELEVRPVQLPGREARFAERAFDRLPPLVAAAEAALRPALEEGPFAFFGHSMGALIAFGLARALRRSGGPLPQHIFASASSAPGSKVNNYHLLPDDEFLRQLRRLGGTRPEVLDEPELVALVVPILRADFAVVETYVHQPEPPLPMPLTVLYGSRDRDVPREKVEGWSREAGAGVEFVAIEGDHFYVTSARDAVLAEVRRRLVG